MAVTNRGILAPLATVETANFSPLRYPLVHTCLVAPFLPSPSVTGCLQVSVCPSGTALTGPATTHSLYVSINEMSGSMLYIACLFMPTTSNWHARAVVNMSFSLFWIYPNATLFMCSRGAFSVSMFFVMESWSWIMMYLPFLVRIWSEAF
jgi:hypothetical protein